MSEELGFAEGYARGVQTGAELERKRIVELLPRWATTDDTDTAVAARLIEKGEK